MNRSRTAIDRRGTRTWTISQLSERDCSRVAALANRRQWKKAYAFVREAHESMSRLGVPGNHYGVHAYNRPGRVICACVYALRGWRL